MPRHRPGRDPRTFSGAGSSGRSFRGSGSPPGGTEARNVHAALTFCPGVRPSGRGIYVLGVRLDAERVLEVGALGDIPFGQGDYAYVGSALGGFAARIRRHLRRQKAVHWHVDALTRAGEVAWVAWAPCDEPKECALADRLAASLDSVPGFGASDCGCPTHLFGDSTPRRLEHAVERAFDATGLDLRRWRPDAACKAREGPDR